MSVVNQMLRDLDRRQAGDDRKVFAQQLRQIDERRRRPWIAFALGAVVVLGAGAYGFSMLGASADVAPVAPPAGGAAARAEPVAATSTAADRAAAEPPAPAAAEETRREVRLDQRPPESRPPAEQPARAAAKQDLVKPSAFARPQTVADATLARTEAMPRTAVPVAPLAPTPPASPTALEAAAPSAPNAAKIDKRFRDDPRYSAEAEFRGAVAYLDRGRMAEARASLRSALALDPRHEAARQTLAALLIESGARDEAEQTLGDGLVENPAQSNFAIVLARLKLDRGDPSGALAVLHEHGRAATGNPEYRAFLAAVLQRLGRHAEAIDEYQAALKLAPGVGVWWIGLGLSQEAADRPQDAAQAFRHAKTLGTLPADVAEFVERKLKSAPR